MPTARAACCVAFCLAGCALFPSIGDLSSGDSGSSPIEAAAEAGIESSADAIVTHSVALAQKAPFTYEIALTHQNALPSPIAPGDFVAAVMVTNNPDANATFSVSDTLGNTWRSTTYHRCANSWVGTRIWYVEGSKAGSDTITVGQSTIPDSGAFGSELGLALFEYSGVASASALDVETGQCTAATTTSMTSGTMTTSATDLLVGVFADSCGQGTMTQGTGWLAEDVYEPYFYLYEDKTNLGAGAPPGSYEATATNPNDSNCWVAVVAGFRLQ